MQAEDHDKVTIRYTSDVSPLMRASILAAIENEIENMLGHHLYAHHDNASDGWSIDITGHDRTVAVELTDAQVVEHLQAIATSKGLTVGQLIMKVQE